jgi:hypothetical protein
MVRAVTDDIPDDDDGGDLDKDWRVRLVRSDPRSSFYDPRYAKPISSSAPGWGEVDPAVLDEARASVPAFPLDVLPQFWREWVDCTAHSTGAPADYVVQSLLAAVVGLCGGGTTVRIGPRWSEPLVLWQVLVGGSSSAKSPAMAPARELIIRLEAEKAGDEEQRRTILLAESSLIAVADAITANPRGVVLWRDDLPEWLLHPVDAARTQWLQAWAAGFLSLGQGTAQRRIDRFAVSLLLAVSPERLSGLFASGEELASRFLFAWPHLPEHSPLAGRKPARDDEALAALRRIARKARPPGVPLELIVDERGLKALDAFLTKLQVEMREADGLDMAWLGKGRGTVARLAGVLELLKWSESGATGSPGHLGAEEIGRAVRLWSDYFRPHAMALVHRAAPREGERQVRRVVRWLRDRGLSEVSREQVRCEALARTVNAAGADSVLYRLQAAGIVSQVHYSTPAQGRPPNKWLVNPRLATRASAGNTGNTGNATAAR